MANLADESKSQVDVESKHDPIITSPDVDDALKFLKVEVAEGSLDAIDEKKLIRKIDWFIMPMLFSVYYLQYTDKTLRTELPISCDNLDSSLTTLNSRLCCCDGYSQGQQH